MSLVVARVFDGQIRIVSDSKITDYSAVRTTPVKGVLKCVVLTSSCCVCFAGRLGLAQAAITPLFQSGNVDRDTVTEHLLREHVTGSCAADFLVASTIPQPVIDRITNGRIEANLSSAWIGDQSAFEAYQAYYHTLDRERSLLFEEGGLRWVSVATRMSDAFRQVVADGRHPSVDDFTIIVTSKPASADGFRYLESSTGSGFAPVSNTTEETSLIRPLGVAGGSYNYTILTPRSSGVGAIGVHFLEGQLGALFFPRVRWEPFLFHDTGIDNFINDVSNQFGVSIDGIRHY